MAKLCVNEQPSNISRGSSSSNNDGRRNQRRSIKHWIKPNSWMDKRNRMEHLFKLLRILWTNAADIVSVFCSRSVSHDSLVFNAKNINENKEAHT